MAAADAGRRRGNSAVRPPSQECPFEHRSSRSACFSERPFIRCLRCGRSFSRSCHSVETHSIPAFRRRRMSPN
jgi:hypothetical protein